MIIPYVISEAYPDKKKPGLRQDFGVVEEENMAYFFLEKVCCFIYYHSDINQFNTLSDVDNFLDRGYYKDCEMHNPPWEAHVFKDNEWINIIPCHDDIFDQILLIKKRDEEEEKKIKDNANEKKDSKPKKEKRDISGELSEDEKDTLLKISEFFDRMLKQSPLSASQISDLEKMSELEKFSTLLTIFITQENYENNKELFKKFLSLLVKFMNKDVQIIVQKMESRTIDNNVCQVCK